MARAMRPAHWYLFLFTSGAASTALEIAGLRFLAPLFGSSLPIWGAAIATVIAGLALGYAHGGRRAREETTILTVVCYACAGAIFFLLMPAVYHWAKVLPGSVGLTLAYAILFVPSVVFGAVNPLAVQVEAARRGEAAGSVAGRISSLTTIGSLLGILLPSFITIPFLGTRETSWVFGGAVLLLSLPLLFEPKGSPRAKSRGPLISIVLLALAAALTSLIPAPPDPDTIFAAETPYQHVAVKQYGSTRALTFDATFGIQSVYTRERYTDGYWDYVAAPPAFLPKENIRVLVLGAAASTSEHQLQKFWAGQKTFEFTSVELDGALFKIADAYFDPPERTTVAADARAFIASDTNQYDIIIVDAYARELTIPFHLVTQEFFETVKPRLAAGG
ncbi:MAG: fused MFS/spermidine synthase, partial [Patescibacteria group bacterium]